MTEDSPPIRTARPIRDPRREGNWYVRREDGSPHLIRYRIDVLDGQSAVTHLYVEPDPDAPSARGITSADLRNVPIRELLGGDREFWEAVRKGGPKAGGAALAALAVRDERSRFTTQELPAVRDLYVLCQERGESARERLKALGVPYSTADRLIRRARERFPDEMGPRTRPGTRKDGHG